MLIGELAKKSGFTRDTIRFYEKRGLIKLHWRSRRENNYKDYPENVLKQLLMIKELKHFGFTLSETANIISLWDSNLFDCQSGVEKIKTKIKQIEERVIELQALKSRLSNAIINCPSDCKIETSLKQIVL